MESYRPENALKVIRTIHFFMIGGPIIFSLFVIYIILPNDPQFVDFENALSYLPLGLGVATFIVSILLFKPTLKQNLADASTLQEKIAAFQTAHIIRLALLEGASLFAIVASLTSSTYLGISVFALLLLIMILTTPTLFKLTEALNLSSEDVSSFDED